MPRRFWIHLLGCVALTPSIGGERSVAADPAATRDESAAIDRAIGDLRAIGPEAAGSDRAIVAAGMLQASGDDPLLPILRGMSQASPLAQNWFRGVVWHRVGRSGVADIDALRAFATDRKENPDGRALAIEVIRWADPELGDTLIAAAIDDPSLLIRELAVDRAMQDAARLNESGQVDAAVTAYQAIVTHARHPQQLAKLISTLKDLGQNITTSGVFAMQSRWQAVGPFDNVAGVGFDAVYPPERSFVADGSVDLDATYDGKRDGIDDAVTWREVTERDESGTIDIAAAFEKEKGAVVYLTTDFESAVRRPAQIRLTSVNANKVWVNGDLVMANEIYHSGTVLDQYVGDFTLRQGLNTVLIKSCQNEQTEGWAQDWILQVRITDDTGKGLRSGQ